MMDDQEFIRRLVAKNERLQHELENVRSLANVAQDRPADSTTKILRAWLGFIDVLFKEGDNAGYKLNNIELASLFALDITRSGSS